MPTSPSLKNLNQYKAPDGGWGWVIVFGSFMVSVIGDGFSYTTGLFYAEFLREYGESETVTSLFDSIMTGTIYCIGPVASGLTTTYGCRKIAILGSILATGGMVASTILDSIYTHCLTLGLITGMGLGFLYLPQVMIVTYWFDKHLSLATGISVCGSGIGIAIFALLSEKLLNVFNSWKSAMLLLASIMFTCVGFSSLFRKVDYMQEKSDLKSALKETFNFKIFKDGVFIYFAIANFLNGSVFYVPIIFLKDHVVKTHIGTDAEAVQLLVYFGLSNAFGRAFFGYVADFQSLNRIVMYGLSIISYGVAIALMASFGTQYIYMIVWVVMFGLSEGAFITLSSVVLVDLFGMDRVTNVFGIINLIAGMASFIGPPLIAKTFDKVTGYTTGFYITSMLTIFSGLMLLMLPLIHKSLDNVWTKKQTDIEENVKK
ncbi:monocarboxylate transporter 4-like [Oppia nitens]|uniref:monocarboxylate transporter 4-like n=1 Tax=Oppia nitens TaxID=1686743 RepID=UPI0023DB92D9|nr:monocarboxylate transporter 4-like [Oppia nitens]